MNDTDLSVVFNMLNNFLQLPQFLKYFLRKYEVNSNELTHICSKSCKLKCLFASLTAMT